MAKRSKLNDSPEGFKEALGEHVKYEIDMFRFTFAALENSGVLWFSAGVLNALIESFCAHARNLVEFFECKRSKAEETIGASHFTGPSYDPFRTPFPGALRGKLNAQISHLSYNRTGDPDSKMDAKDRRELLRIIEDEIQEFDRHLTATYRDVFPPEIASNRMLFLSINAGIGAGPTNALQSATSMPTGPTPPGAAAPSGPT